MSYGSSDGSDGTTGSDQTAAVPMLAEAWASEETGQAGVGSDAPEQMGRTPSWAEGLVMCADGYETEFYKKD